jgi:hypothetical protein
MDENMPDRAEATASESVLETGTEVGELARTYFGEYQLVDFSFDKREMCQKTEEFLKRGETVIAEASFLYENCFCSIDILRVVDDKLQLIEVKSSTEIHDIYYDDMAYQYYVLSNAGFPVESVWNMHINNEYVRHGELNLKELFILEDCTDKILEMQDEISNRLDSMEAYLQQENEPGKELDICCEKPYECAYKKYCHRNIAEPSVFSIHRLAAKKKYELYHQGIVSYEDIVREQPQLSEKQYQQVYAAYENLPPKVDQEKIQEFLNSLSYPLYHLDFETYQQAIPQFDGVKPYMQIPFQYSLHVQQSAGAQPEHYEFLGKEGTDPRRALAEQLCAQIPMDVCSLAYNMSFEKTVIKNLAQLYPDLSEHLMNIHDNMHDLMVPFQQQAYYCKELQGSYSIKWVLPALCRGDPELDYHALEGVHNGSEAMAAFADLPKHTEKEIAKIRANLLAYCRLDTLAMVKILETLYGMV